MEEDYLKKINTPENLQATLEAEQYAHIPINYLPGKYIHLYYKESNISAQLKALLDEDIEDFSHSIVQNAPSIPVIVMDSTLENVVTAGNVDSSIIGDSTSLHLLLQKLKKKNEPIETYLSDKKVFIFYEESPLLKITFYLPFVTIALIILLLFILGSFFIFYRKLEQNLIWNGLSKETAHQLGTPISSLMAWTEILKSAQVRPDIITEIEKDTQRLDSVARRFSQIGSIPLMEKLDLSEQIRTFTDYYRIRISSKIRFRTEERDESYYVSINKDLFFWVLENISKNAVDAMEGEGELLFQYGKEKKYIYLDISDTGKGMSKNTIKEIFTPGFTTKSRGWGVGLSLCKRIIENYHHGKINIPKSEKAPPSASCCPTTIEAPATSPLYPIPPVSAENRSITCLSYVWRN